jgi:outer membrane lipoprotein-sorting protein
MIEYLILNIEYLRTCKKRSLAAMLITAACLGCAGSKGISDSNVPARAAVTANTVPDANKVNAVLAKLDQKSREIKTYEAKIIYLFKQPTLESEALRTGVLYYVNDEKGSKLRINFTALRQDNEPAPNYREEYLFDGVNLTRIDYKLKNVEYRQLTDANKPLNAFELASEYLPIIGFANTKNLKINFDVSIAKENGDAIPADIKLHLATKPDSKYAKDYKYIDFWVDRLTSLPVRMVAASGQEDIYDIRLEDAKVNKGLAKGIFTIEVPADFSKNVIPLEKERK